MWVAGTLPPFTTIGSGSGLPAAGVLLGADDAVFDAFVGFGAIGVVGSSESESLSLAAGLVAKGSVGCELGAVAAGAGAAFITGAGAG